MQKWFPFGWRQEDQQGDSRLKPSLEMDETLFLESSERSGALGGIWLLLFMWPKNALRLHLDLDLPYTVFQIMMSFFYKCRQNAPETKICVCNNIGLIYNQCTVRFHPLPDQRDWLRAPGAVVAKDHFSRAIYLFSSLFALSVILNDYKPL